jgi:hypothetical protein
VHTQKDSPDILKEAPQDQLTAPSNRTQAASLTTATNQEQNHQKGSTAAENQKARRGHKESCT